MRSKSALFWLSIPAMMLIVGTVARAEPQIGSVVQKEFRGASGTRVATTSAEELPFTHFVFAGEEVITPESGSTVMRFADQTQLQVGANSSVVLDRFVYDPDAKAVSGSIKLAKGIFRYIGGQATSEAGLQITTPTATLTIRGTKFVAFVADDGGTTVGVLEGAVDVTPCGNGETAHATSGQALQVTPACTTLMVFIDAMPSDPAVSGDYSVAGGDDNAGRGGNGGNHGSGGGPQK